MLTSPPVIELNIQISPKNWLAPPPDLMSRKSIVTDETDSTWILDNEAPNEQSHGLKPLHISYPSLETVNTNASTPPRRAHEVPPKHKSRRDNPESPGKQSNSLHNKPKNPSNNGKRKKKSSSRKNNLVILPWNVPFRHSKSDLSATLHNQEKSPLPPPHPLSHISSYPPTTHPHYVTSQHRYPQHFHSSCSFASDASSSEATPVTCPANIRRDRNCSIDETLGASVKNEDEMLDDEREITSSYVRQNSCGTYEGDPYFQDFDDTISKDSVANKDGELVGVNVQDCRDVPLVNVVPHSISTNSLVGLNIPQKMHGNKASLEFSPASLYTFADAHGNISPMPLIPTETITTMPPTASIQFQSQVDDGSVLSMPQCANDETPPASPNPHLQISKQKRHHRHQSSLVSCSESCLQSQCSIDSQNIFNYPNPCPHIFQEGSPLDSPFSFEGDRSLCADEKAFVQQIHNSGLSSMSFEHVEDALEHTSMDVEMELVYNSGSFDCESIEGESLGSSESVISIKERKEMERIYRKFREKRSRMGPGLQNATMSNDPHYIVPTGVPPTPVASNKALQQLQMPYLHDIDQFNQECEDSCLEMAPLKASLGPVVLKEKRVQPDISPARRTYHFAGDFLWQWLMQISSHTANIDITKQQPRYDFSFKGFDDVDFDRSDVTCSGCCFRRQTRARFYSNSLCWIQTGWPKLFLISFGLLVGWVFSKDWLEKHKSHDDHHLKHDYNIYGKDDPLAKDLFLPHKRVEDDTNNLAQPVSPSEDDQLGIYHFLNESYSKSDDVFVQFEMEDDIFDPGNQASGLQDDNAIRRHDKDDK